MGFYMHQPFDTAEAIYVWTGQGAPGFFAVTVKGQAPNFTTGIMLVRNTEWVGGLAVAVMGWTGPSAAGTRPYTLLQSYPGTFAPEIVVIGSNKTEHIKVKEMPFTTDEAYIKTIGS